MGGTGSGRKRKPVAVARLEGDTRRVGAHKFRERTNAVVEGIGSPCPPSYLNSDERRLWTDIVAALPAGMVTRADEGILEVCAVYWARFRQAGQMIASTGLLVQSSNGPIRNPLLVVQNTCARALSTCVTELGLSPTARARMIATGSVSDDPMELLLGGDDDGAWSTLRRRH